MLPATAVNGQQRNDWSLWCRSNALQRLRSVIGGGAAGGRAVSYEMSQPLKQEQAVASAAGDLAAAVPPAHVAEPPSALPADQWCALAS